MARKIHVDGGKSTRDLIDAKKLIEMLPLKAGDTFLDAGCGDGFISIEAASAVGDDGRVIAVDIYPQSVEILRSRIGRRSNIIPLVADITRRIPVPDRTVDVYFMANVFHGIVVNDEVEPLMAEVMRLLRRTGRLVVVDFKKVAGTPGPHMDLRLSEDEVTGILEDHGFTVESVGNAGPHHYLIIAVPGTEKTYQ
ncbi:class I SAM-dependent methyltransferase [Methanothermobacter sp.]|uniref:class I SAM-dependent methyltransferase n=1 Tax=Methanothermobacter sp. TaxID=1884223 RepID=UPI003C70F990